MNKRQISVPVFVVAVAAMAISMVWSFVRERPDSQREPRPLPTIARTLERGSVQN